MKENRLMKMAIFGITWILGLRGIMAGPEDTPVFGDISLLTISGYILTSISGLGIIALAYNSFKSQKK